ncbi:MAG TPA: class I SAM-dependent methyltransferase [Verrucomicrobiae bacterium]|nr:class I SAM-dependent methyltransferase [Verrucomicrobiae bacterium]
MTRRTGALFVHEYGGYETVEDFADDLPEGARVLDVGAGKSAFGLNVARWRDDVEWTNADIRYNMPGMRESVGRHAPPNVRYVPADALRLLDAFEEGEFDRVFSNWMMPHISMAGRNAGVIAARNMLAVASPDGEVAVAPCRPRAPGVEGRMFMVDMAEHTPAELDGIAEDMAAASRYNPIGAGLQYLVNQLAHRIEPENAIQPEHMPTGGAATDTGQML